MLADYLKPGRWRRQERVHDRPTLVRFLNTRASYIAQTSLYGYLRTRAGMRYPELFTDDVFVVSINIAKWQVWLACLSDLAVYAGGMLARQATRDEASAVSTLMQGALEDVLHATGVPAEAGDEFAAHAERARARVRVCDWSRIRDDESAFSESPTALVRWAPIIDELKQLDEAIVRNSIRFRWQEVRRDLRRDLDAPALLAGAGDMQRD